MKDETGRTINRNMMLYPNAGTELRLLPVAKSILMSKLSTMPCMSGIILTKRCVMEQENMIVMRMEMDSAKSMSTRWKAFGRSCTPGCIPIGVFLRKSYPYVWASLSLSIMLKTAAKPC